MWSEALSMLDRAERMQRQFFTLSLGASSDRVAWESPVDIVETADTLQVEVALPGVAADSVTIAFDPAGMRISATRVFPCHGEAQAIHRIEIPYGRFERYVGLPLGDPYSPLELASKSLADGVLTLVFRKKEGA